MNKSILTFICAASVFTGTLRAQEFALHVIAELGHDTTTIKNVRFGFDAVASDSMTDVQWFGGEKLIPNLTAPDVDLRMVSNILNRPYLRGNDYDGGYIDIRRKPAVDSFVMQYEMRLTIGGNGDSMHLMWDRSHIPPLVKHIYVSAEALSLDYIRLDMTKQSNFDFPMQLDSINLYYNILITLLYNQDKLGVNNSIEPPHLSEVLLYPSITTEFNPIYLSLNEQGIVSVTVYDITGRKMRSYLIGATEGSNELPPLHLPAGMYIVEIRDNNHQVLLGRQKLIVE